MIGDPNESKPIRPLLKPLLTEVVESQKSGSAGMYYSVISCTNGHPAVNQIKINHQVIRYATPDSQRTDFPVSLHCSY